jgi:hypothetical protein
MDARIATALPQHPKTKKLFRRLGAAGPLGCIYLFLWAAANRSDGDLSGMTDEDIELAVDWNGDAGAFVSAMSEVGFLDGPESQRFIHDWEEHNPWAAGSKSRSEKARWAALCMRHGSAEAARIMPEYAASRHQASSTLSSNELVAELPAKSSSAPSLSPSPSPSLSPRSKDTSPIGEESAEAPPAADHCPHADIVAIYHEVLPSLPRVREWTESRQQMLRKRWRESTDRQSLDWWREFFAYVGRSDFLMGRKPARGGEPFECDLEWLVRPRNFVKVIEGRYENRGVAA